MELEKLSTLALRYTKTALQQQIEDCQYQIRKHQRQITRTKDALKLLATVEKELARPPKPLVFGKLNKKERAALNRLRKNPRPPGIPAYGGV